MLSPVAFLAGAMGCFLSYVTYVNFNIEVEGLLPIPVKIRAAQDVTSPENLRQLRDGVRKTFADAQRADGLQLVWRMASLKSTQGGHSETVIVVVQVPVAGDRGEAHVVMEYCVKLVRSWLAERLAKRPGAKRAFVPGSELPRE